MSDLFKKLPRPSIYLVVGIFFLASSTFGCSYLNKRFGLQDDNLIEQTVEALIQEETGVSVDLTPNAKSRSGS